MKEYEAELKEFYKDQPYHIQRNQENLENAFKKQHHAHEHENPGDLSIEEKQDWTDYKATGVLPDFMEMLLTDEQKAKLRELP